MIFNGQLLEEMWFRHCARGVIGDPALKLWMG